MISVNMFPIILSNIFYVVISLLIYQLFVIERPISKKAKGLVVFLLAAVVVVLCIITPIKLGSEYHFDLRQIPMIIGFLYGGPTVGTGIYILLITTRFLMGGIGAVGALMENSVILLVLFLISKKYSGASRQGKYVYSMMLSLLSFILSIIIFIMLTGMDNVINLSVMQLIIYIIQMGVLCLSVYFIEVMIRNKKMRDKLFQAEKMEIVSHLAASVSHEIRNPLTVTRGFLQLLSENGITEKNQKEFINISIKEIDRAVDIISDYLTFAKPSLEKKESLAIANELKSIIEVMAPFAKMKSVQFIVKIETECFMIGEKQKFNQSILNILKNCIEAMPNGGFIHINTDVCNSMYRITIEDGGIGMSEEQIKRLGEPYFSSKEKGTGLGMMVVYSNIKALNGKISVQSELGKGTKFTIELPIDQSMMVK